MDSRGPADIYASLPREQNSKAGQGPLHTFKKTLSGLIEEAHEAGNEDRGELLKAYLALALLEEQRNSPAPH